MYSKHRNLWHVTCDVIIQGGGGEESCPVTTMNLLWKSKRSFEKVYYKVWLTLLQSATALFITKCDGGVLQSATAILLQSVIEVIKKCDRYYKVWLRLLQSATGITKCDEYYKVRRLLQSATVHGDPAAPTSYYWIKVRNKAVRVFCDMDKYGEFTHSMDCTDIASDKR